MGLLLRSLAFGLLLIAVRTPAQEAGPAGRAPATPPKAVILIVPRPQAGEQDAPFLKILAGALEIDLARAGLEVRQPEASSLPALAAAPLERLLAEAADADFLILEGYTSRDQTVRVDLEVLRVSDGQRIASASTSRRIDLRLDEAVSEVVDQVLPQMQPEIEEAVARRRQAEESRPPEAVAMAEQPPAEEEPGSPAPGPPEAPAEAPAVKPEPGPAAQLRPGQPGPGPETWTDHRLEAGAGGAMFFPVTDLEPLFRIGYQAEAYLAYRLRRAALALGVYAGYTGLLPEQQGTASFFDALVPVGLDLRLGTLERTRLGVHLRLQAGGVLNVSEQSKVDQRLTRVLPQVKAGAGLRLAVNPRMGVALEVLYELMLYMYLKDGKLQAEPIMGFNVPTIYFYRRW